MLRSYRRLTQLLGGPERAAVAAASAVPPQPQSPGSAALSSQAGHATSVQDHAEEVWWDELEAVADHRGSGGSDGGRRRFGGRRTPPLDAPIDRPRTLRDYQRMMLGLSRRKRAYLMRDVLEEMSLNGVRPDQQILTTGLLACMKRRKLGDALFFFEEMKRRGIQLDSFAYGAAMSACGRAGQLAPMLALRDEMLAAGLPMTHGIRLALLHTYADFGRLGRVEELLGEIAAAGQPANEFAWSGLANCYRHMPRKLVPKDADARLLQLLEDFRAAQAAGGQQQAAAAAEAGEYDADAHLHGDEHPGRRPMQQRGSGERTPYSPQLVVTNAVLNSLVEMGYHEAAKALFAGLADQGLAPDHTTYANLIRSHVQQALGWHRQPYGAALAAILDERLQGADLEADVQAALQQDALLRAALQAAEEAEAAGLARSAGTEGAASAEAAAALAGAAHESEGEDEAEPSASVFGASQSGPSSSSSTPLAGEEEEEEEAGHSAHPLVGGHDDDALDNASSSGGGGQQHSAAQRQAFFAHLSAAQLRQVARDRGAGRARSRLRWQVFREHLDIDAWFEALHLFQEVLDLGLAWGPGITAAMVKASLDLQAAGVEHALEVAHTVMDTFAKQGLFLDVPTGTQLLLLAVRRDVGDLSLAHRIYDGMHATQRVPKTPALFKYMRAVALREPHNHERLVELCSRITSDPDRSPRALSMKSEAYARKKDLLRQLQRQR